MKLQHICCLAQVLLDACTLTIEEGFELDCWFCRIEEYQRMIEEREKASKAIQAAQQARLRM